MAINNAATFRPTRQILPLELTKQLEMVVGLPYFHGTATVRVVRCARSRRKKYLPVKKVIELMFFKASFQTMTAQEQLEDVITVF